MLLSSVSESTCFFLGALSDMPAVRAFALYAGMALLIDFLMQMTVFVSLLALDMARQESRRYDILCCVRASKKAAGGSSASSCSGDGGDGAAGGGADGSGSEGTLYRVFKVLYAPFLMKRWVRPAVVVIFFGWFCASLAVAPRVEVGLDQEISMPDDSFVLKYFEYLKHFLSVGPPFYIVLNTSSLSFDFTDPALQNKVCGSSGCDADSLQSQIRLWSRQSEVTYVASPAQSWIDDYFDWLTNPACCSYDPQTLEVCQSNPSHGEKQWQKPPKPSSPTSGPTRSTQGSKTRGQPPISSSATPSQTSVGSGSSTNKKATASEETDGGEDDDDFFDSDFFDDSDSDFFGGGDGFSSSEEGTSGEKSGGDTLEDHFKNYDEFYYYSEESAESIAASREKVVKRAAERYKRQAVAAGNGSGGGGPSCRRCATVAAFGGVKKRPQPMQFRQHLKWFVEDNPGEVCPSAGKAAYRWVQSPRAIFGQFSEPCAILIHRFIFFFLSADNCCS